MSLSSLLLIKTTPLLHLDVQRRLCYCWLDSISELRTLLCHTPNLTSLFTFTWKTLFVKIVLLDRFKELWDSGNVKNLFAYILIYLLIYFVSTVHQPSSYWPYHFICLRWVVDFLRWTVLNILSQIGDFSYPIDTRWSFYLFVFSIFDWNTKWIFN